MNAKVLTQKQIITAKDTGVKSNLVSSPYITNNYYLFSLGEVIINTFYIANTQRIEAKGATSLRLFWSLYLSIVLQENYFKTSVLNCLKKKLRKGRHQWLKTVAYKMYATRQAGFGTGTIIRKVQCTIKSKQIAVNKPSPWPFGVKGCSCPAEQQQSLVGPVWVQCGISRSKVLRDQFQMQSQRRCFH